MILVKHILEGARQRLVVLSENASVPDVAEILANPDTPLVVVCDGEGSAVGVISRTDIVRIFGRLRADACSTTAAAIMTKAILSCHADETLQSVWTALSTRGLRCAPILDDSRKPQGIVHARDLARALIDEVTSKKLLLRDYMLGVGYQ